MFKTNSAEPNSIATEGSEASHRYSMERNASNITSRAEALLNLKAFYWAGMMSLVRKERVSKEIANIRAVSFPHHQPGLELTGESH